MAEKIVKPKVVQGDAYTCRCPACLYTYQWPKANINNLPDSCPICNAGLPAKNAAFLAAPKIIINNQAFVQFQQNFDYTYNLLTEIMYTEQQTAKAAIRNLNDN